MEDIIIPQASLFMGIIPALIILYFSLKNYEGLYKEKYIFVTFVIGILMGALTLIVDYLVTNGFKNVIFIYIIIYIVLIAFFGQLIKTIVLNLPRFHEKQETVIYGLCLGLGFGAAFTPFFVIAISTITTSNALVITIIAIGSIGMVFFHAASGMFIGYGIFRKKLLKYLLLIILIEVPVGLIGKFLLLTPIIASNLLEQSALSLGLLLYSIILFYYIITKILPQILPQSGRRKRVQQKMRKED